MSEGEFHADRIYLGWRHVASQPDPGPPPRRPTAPGHAEVDPGWVAAQRREEGLISRPFRVAAGGWSTAVAVVLGLGQAGILGAALVWLGAGACGLMACWNAREVWLGRRALRRAVEAEKARVGAVRMAQERQLAAWQEEHARRFREWERSREESARQPRWFPVTIGDDVDRVDLVGGTLPGWAALLTTVAAPRLATGGEVTVVDLSGGAVAGDLVALARSQGVEPLVWVLPGDLPRFDLGVGLPADALADVLSVSAAADRDSDGGLDPARDHAIIERVLQVLGDGAGIAGLAAGLRALAQVGEPRRDIDEGLLTPGQLEQITGLFGRGAADRVVTERAWSLEARLRVLADLGRDPVRLPASDLRVVALDPRGGMSGGALIGTYTAVALTHLLRQLPPGEPWRHTVCVLGAERLRGDVLDRLGDACAASRTGLLLGYRSAQGPVRERLGRGNAAAAFMRLGNAEDAKAASEQIGSEHRFVVTQLTDTVGASLTGTVTDSYTSTVGESSSRSASVSASQTSGSSEGRGRSRADLAPFAQRSGTSSRDTSRSHGVSDSLSLTAGISSSTSWGISTAAAAGASQSLARTAQRSREFLVEAHELQQLPASAVIVSYPAPHGRLVMLADANPGIAALPAATLLTPEQAQAKRHGGAPDGEAGGPRPARGQAPGDTPVPELPGWTARPPAGQEAARPQAAAPNLGPPPRPLDWRRGR